MTEQRKTHEKACEQCGTTFMTRRLGQRFCSYRCAGIWRHAHVTFTYRTGSESPLWKSEMDNYKSMHVRIRRERGRADGCALREDKGCTSQTFEWSHIHGTDPWDTANYRMLCKSCHVAYDGQKGSGHSNAKLTPEQVATIRARYAAGGVSQDSLGCEYGVDQTTVSKIVRKITY